MFGTIKKLAEKGFGFITAEDERKDIFFHASALDGVRFDDLRQGDRVEFEIVETDKGLNARNVTLA